MGELDVHDVDGQKGGGKQAGRRTEKAAAKQKDKQNGQRVDQTGQGARNGR